MSWPDNSRTVVFVLQIPQVSMREEEESCSKFDLISFSFLSFSFFSFFWLLKRKQGFWGVLKVHVPHTVLILLNCTPRYPPISLSLLPPLFLPFVLFCFVSFSSRRKCVVSFGEKSCHQKHFHKLSFFECGSWV